MPSTSTDSICIGSMSGFIFITIGADTISSKYPLTISMLLLSSIMAESILVLSPNSNMTMLMFSLETLFMFSSPDVVASACSKGWVTDVSTLSGLAPG